MEASAIWKKLLVDGKKITTTNEIHALSTEIGRDEKRSLYYLQEEGYIVRIFRGIFYVRNLEERARRSQECSIYKMVAMGLREKGVKNWYFALETALKLNLMTHEFFFLDYVITDSYRTTKIISIDGEKFRFIKRGKEHFKEGITEEKLIRYSDKEKTILDISYREYLRSRKLARHIEPIEEYRDMIDPVKTKRYLIMYPEEFRKILEELL